MFHHHIDSPQSPGAFGAGQTTGHAVHLRTPDPGGHGAQLHSSAAAAPHHAAPHHAAPGRTVSLNRLAFLATLHCLSGCAVGEVLGMVIGTALGLSNGLTIGLAVALAFVFGYAFTMLPLLRHGMGLRQALKLALVADTASIAIMEVVDNLIMLAIPGAMDAGLDSLLFWSSLIFALAVAGLAAFPINRWLIARGRGHAVMHAFHPHA